MGAFAAMTTSDMTYLSDCGGSVLDRMNLVVAVSHLSAGKPHVTISTNVALPQELNLEESEGATRARMCFVRGRIAFKLIQVPNKSNEFDVCFNDGESDSLFTNGPSGGKQRWSEVGIKCV